MGRGGVGGEGRGRGVREGSRGGWDGMLQTSFRLLSLLFRVGGWQFEELELRLALVLA